jgi:REP element-mobilizing transposase RayT
MFDTLALSPLFSFEDSAQLPVAPSQIAHALKGMTARKVFQQFPEVKKHLWGGAFWSRLYYVGNIGDMSVETVLKYIALRQDEAGRDKRYQFLSLYR